MIENHFDAGEEDELEGVNGGQPGSSSPNRIQSNQRASANGVTNGNQIDSNQQ